MCMHGHTHFMHDLNVLGSIHTHTHTHTHTHMHMHTHTHTWENKMPKCLYVCMHACRDYPVTLCNLACALTLTLTLPNPTCLDSSILEVCLS